MMDRDSQAVFRASIEDALNRRFQDLEEATKSATVNGFSPTDLNKLAYEDMLYLRGLLSQYKCRLNRVRSPLVRLPPEIFPSILAPAVSGVYGDLFIWLKYGHVCHDIRVALLGMRDLWAEVVFHRPYIHVHDELLRRAGSSPLTIWFYLNSPTHIINSAMALLVRARRIVVCRAGLDIMRPLISSLGQGSFELLDTLEINPSGLHESPIGAFSNQDELVIPAVRTLALYGVYLPFDPSKLTTLSLSKKLGAPPLLDALSVVIMLRRCMLLEKLSLSEWIPDCNILSTLPENDAIIRLPRLSQLCISQDEARVLQFWSFLESGRALRAFIAHTLANGIPSISRLSVEFLEFEGVLQLSVGYPSPSTSGDSPWRAHQSYALRFSTPSDELTPSMFIGFIECICTSLQLRVDAIDTVHYRFGEEQTLFDERDDNKHYLFTIFPAITTLRLSSPRIDINFFLKSMSSGHVGFFPRLQNLHLKRNTPFSFEYLEELVEAIRTRTVDGSAPLNSLTLEGSEAQLSKVVEYASPLTSLVTDVWLKTTYRSMQHTALRLA
ncbi:unnamed protein product [Peniophora sp. CBMAI 1063]|nr:unnamed protein product [Peniophora sp. CBMAI 1063]